MICTLYRRLEYHLVRYRLWDNGKTLFFAKLFFAGETAVVASCAPDGHQRTP
jgi:hypothetical protein